jgi:tRNA nucleotidyltransferase (CCA-adding enzyme)
MREIARSPGEYPQKAVTAGNVLLQAWCAMRRWEHFAHDSDIGVRGFGETRNEAFEQAALALTAVVCEPGSVEGAEPVEIRCTGPDDEVLLVEWLNALIFEMATRGMLFRRFDVRGGDREVAAVSWGERVDRERHCPAVEPKGATFTELAVRKDAGGGWIAQCVVDV